ncbi:MAG: serine hydrolase [Flavobacteriales bacterium]|nr:serine hydrolase [Flavobacteriales bacterium]
MKIKHLKFIIIGIAILLISPSIAQTITSKQIDEMVAIAMKTNPHVGIAVAVVKDGKVIHEKGYGLISVENKEKVNEHTRFSIASNSKAFTSAALALLVDAGKLSWTDKVVQHIPEFTMYESYVTAEFTILDLLTHRSGLGLGAGDLMFFPDGGSFTIDDLLKSFQYQTKTSDFRTKYDYDNLLYVEAGEVIKRVSGKSWSEFVETELMKPLGMNETAGNYSRLKDKSNVAMPHSTVDGELKQIETFDINMGAAAAGIYSSVHDLSKWMIMHLEDGKNGTQQLISKENHDLMWQPYTNIHFDIEPKGDYKTHFTAYGLGWKLRDVKGLVEVSHTGGMPGMLSKTTMIPELNVGIVVLTNSDPGGYSYEMVSRSIADVFYGVEDKEWFTFIKGIIERRSGNEDSVVTQVWNTVKAAGTKQLDLSNFTGVYQDDWFGEMKVSIIDGQLYLASKKSPKLSGPMAYYKANTFAVKWDYQDMQCDAFAMFILDEEGRATGFKMKGISPNIDFSFDFQDLDLVKVK